MYTCCLYIFLNKLKKIGLIFIKNVRKIICSVNSPEISALLDLIETQSKTTLGNWVLSYAEEKFIPIYKKTFSDDRLYLTLKAAKDWFDKKIKLPEVKNYIYDCHTAAKEAYEYPAAQAAARAVAHSASVAHTASHTLGFAIYGITAVLYDSTGTNETKQTYDTLAGEECFRMEEALRRIAITDEKNPAKINWGPMKANGALFERCYNLNTKIKSVSQDK